MDFKVRVKDEKINEKLISDRGSREYELAFASMAEYYNKVGTIESYDNGQFQLYFEDGEVWWWTKRQIEIIPSISGNKVKKLLSLANEITNEEADDYDNDFSIGVRKIICFCERQIKKENLTHKFDPYSYSGIQRYLLYFLGLQNRLWLDNYVESDPYSSLNFLVSNFERNSKLLVNE